MTDKSGLIAVDLEHGKKLRTVSGIFEILLSVSLINNGFAVEGVSFVLGLASGFRFSWDCFRC